MLIVTERTTSPLMCTYRGSGGVLSLINFEIKFEIQYIELEILYNQVKHIPIN